MTLQYDSLPAAEDAEEWQRTHPPLVTVRVWLGPEHTGMARVTWCESINAEAEAMLKPLDEMLHAAAALHSTAHRLELGLTAAVAYRDGELEPAGGEGN